MARTPEEISIVNTYGNPINPATEETLQSVLSAVQAGGGNGAILDGVSSSIKATVLDYTSSNPLAVRLSDSNGDYVAAGAGTQYTEDAPAAANPVGSSVNLIRSDTPATQTTTDGDNVAQRGTNYGAAYVQVVNSSGAFVDTFGGGTQYADGAVRGTATGTLAMGDDGTNIQSIKVDSAGELQVDVLTMPTVAVTGTFYQATQPVSAASLPLPTGASTSAKQPALGTAGVASTDVISVQGIASMIALKVDGSAVTQPVSGTFWQATQPVSGTFYQATQPVSIAATVATDMTDEATRLLGVVYGSQGAQLQQKVTSNDLIITLDGESVAVTGTFYQATQPISAASLPLPTGASTSALQGGGLPAALGAGGGLKVDGSGTSLPVTEASASAIKTAVELIDNAIAGTEMQVDVVAALPAGTNAIGKLLPSDVDVTTNTNHADKYYTSAGAVTDGIIWSPAAGKRWHITTLYINVSAAATVTIEDDVVAGDVVRWKGELAANSGVVLTYSSEHPFASGEDAADLIITTSAGNVYVQAVGFEI